MSGHLPDFEEKNWLTAINPSISPKKRKLDECVKTILQKHFQALPQVSGKVGLSKIHE